MKERGWEEVEVYEDNDVSASTAKSRPGYQRMLADLSNGRVNAVVVWDLDRLTRRPIEIEHFIDLADQKQTALASVGGDADLATDNGRLFARIKGAGTQRDRAQIGPAAIGEPATGQGRSAAFRAEGVRVLPRTE